MNESLEDNIKRELKEELGVEIAWLRTNPSYFVKALHSVHSYPIANVIFEIGIA
jgi:NADH pyrophosphatase NudC (nudix superfamily)